MNQKIYPHQLIDNTVKEERELAHPLLTTLFCFVFLGISFYGITFSAASIGNSIGKYFHRLNNLTTYVQVEREGECNIFVNGLNEQLIICPQYRKSFPGEH